MSIGPIGSSHTASAARGLAERRQRRSERTGVPWCPLQTARLRSSNRRSQYHPHTDITLSSQVWKCTQRPCLLLPPTTVATAVARTSNAQRDFRPVRPAPSPLHIQVHPIFTCLVPSSLYLLFLLLRACLWRRIDRLVSHGEQPAASSRTRTNLKAVPDTHTHPLTTRHHTHSRPALLSLPVRTQSEFGRWKQDAHARRRKRRRRRSQTSSSGRVGLGGVCSLWPACCCWPHWHRGRCQTCKNG